MPFHHPFRNRRVHFLELPREKMIHARYDDKFFLARQRLYQIFHFVHIAKFVQLAVDKELWLCALAQEREIGVVHRRSQSNAFDDAIILAANAQADETSKAEPGYKQRLRGKFLRQKVERRGDVASLAAPAIVGPGAHARPAKIESQYS